MKELQFRTTGMSHYEETFKSIRELNPDFKMAKTELAEAYDEGDRVWKYEYPYSKVELVPEPGNEYDPDAIAVCLDGAKVGFIRRENCIQVKDLIASGKIKGIDAEVHGGVYKKYYLDDEEKPVIKTDESPLFVHLTVYVDETEEPQIISEKIPESSTTKEKPKRTAMQIFTMILSIVLILMSLLLLIVTPAGFIGIALGIFCFIKSRR